MPLCRKGDGYFIGIYSKKLDRRTIIALNAQHMNSLLSDRMAQLFLTYDVSTLVHNNTSACRRQKIFGFLAMKGHQLTRFILIKKFQFEFSWGGVGPILGGGVYFPSRGRVALRASRGGIPPSPLNLAKDYRTVK